MPIQIPSKTVSFSKAPQSTGYTLLAVRPLIDGVIRLFRNRLGEVVGTFVSLKGKARVIQTNPALHLSQQDIPKAKALLNERRLRLRYDGVRTLHLELLFFGGAPENETEDLEVTKTLELHSRLQLGNLGRMDISRLFQDVKYLSTHLEDFASTFNIPACLFLARTLHRSVDFLLIGIAMNTAKMVSFRKERKLELIKALNDASELLDGRGLLAEQAKWSVEAAKVGISMLPENQENWELFKQVGMNTTTRLGVMFKLLFDIKSNQQLASSSWYADLLGFRSISLKRDVTLEELLELIGDSLGKMKEPKLVIGVIDQLTEIALHAKEQACRNQAFVVLALLTDCYTFETGVFSLAADYSLRYKDLIFKPKQVGRTTVASIEDQENGKVRGAALEAMVLLSQLPTEDEELRAKAVDLLEKRIRFERDQILVHYFEEEYMAHSAWVNRVLPKPSIHMKKTVRIPPRPEFFVDRSLDLETAWQALETKGNNHLQLIGEPGSGKSTEAAEFARKTASDYNWVYWVNGSKFTQDIRELALRLGAILSTEDLDDQKVANRLTTFLEKSSKKWLIILDNPPSKNYFLSRLPKSGGRILSTSQKNRDGVDGLQIPPLTEEEALELLNHATERESSTLREIARKLNYNPLGITVATAFIKETNSTPKEYLKALQRGSEEPQNPLETATWPLYVAFTATFDQITTENPEAIEVLKRASLCAPRGIPPFILEDPKPLFGTSSEVDVLLSYHLLKRDGGDCFGIDELTQQIAAHFFFDRKKSEKLECLETIMKRLAEQYDRTKDEPSSIWLLASHFAQFPTLASHANIHIGAETAQFLDFMGLALAFEEHDFTNAFLILHQALEVRINTYGETDPSLAETHVHLSLVFRLQKNFEEAEEHLRKALSLREAHYGKKHPEIAKTFVSFASLAAEQGDPTKAKDFLGKVHGIYQEAYGEKHVETAKSLHGLAAAYAELKLFDDAITLWNKALVIFKGLDGDQYEFITAILSCLSQTYRTKKEFSSEIATQKQLLQLLIKTLGNNDDEVAKVWHDLAVTYSLTEKYDEAIDCLLKGLQACNDVQRNPLAGSLLLLLAELCQQQKKYPDAIACYNNLVVNYQHRFGNSDPRIASVYFQIGEIQFVQMKDFMNPHMKALEMRTQTLGNDDPKTAASLVKVACAFYAQDDKDQAVDLMQQAKSIFQTKKMELETIETDYYLHLMRLSASGNEQSGSLKANDAEIFKRLKQLYPDDKKCSELVMTWQRYFMQIMSLSALFSIRNVLGRR